MDDMKQFIDNFKSRLAKLSFNQKVLLGAVAMASILSVSVFSVWLQKDEKAVLFTGLSPEDASAAIAELSKRDIPTELTNGGTTIMVPENVVNELLVDLHGKGIITNGKPGWELFDGKQYGLTDFVQNVNFQRALEGELTRTIESLQGIQSADVHLTLPKPSIFQKLDTGASAAIVLHIGRGGNMRDDQVRGIQSLVACSVENLDAEMVRIIDQNGRELSSAIIEDDIGRSENQLSLRKEVEDHLARKAASMLDRALGVGRSNVEVSAILNFEKIDSQREIYDPQGSVVRSEERDESNDPQSGGTAETSTTNYEINRTVEHVVSETGGIKSLSVAVFVDGTYEVPEDGGEAVYSPVSEEQINQLRRVVQTAIGIDATRGDKIEVVNMQFHQTVENPGGGLNPDWIGIVTQYGGKVVLIIMLAVMALALKKNMGQLISETFQPAIATTPDGKELSEEHFDGIPDMDDTVIHDIQEYASENPERVAEVIQSWIHELDLSDNARTAVGS